MTIRKIILNEESATTEFIPTSYYPKNAETFTMRPYCTLIGFLVSFCSPVTPSPINPDISGNLSAVAPPNNISPGIFSYPKEIFHNSVHVYSNDSSISRIEAENAEELMDSILQQIKSFIHASYFDVRRFEQRQVELTERLTLLQPLIQYATPTNRKLLQRYRFAKHMFQIMNRCAQNMSLCNLFGSTDRALVYYMTETRVMLFTLYDDQGFLDPDEPGSIQKLQIFARQIQLWTHTFRTMPNIPEHTQKLFEIQRMGAQEVVDALCLQVPPHSNLTSFHR
ncbi:hypothetical protein JCM33374_g4404 [Metschnikowia sp. JCM 33374]|nr:hypothetical protein JCM33374_g4404 [Metschnikowia sp. JCM 33374]